MTHENIPLPESSPDVGPTLSPRAQPELGDAIDSLEDAAISLKQAVINETDAVIDDARQRIRENPLVASLVVASVAYLIGRLTR